MIQVFTFCSRLKHTYRGLVEKFLSIQCYFRVTLVHTVKILLVASIEKYKDLTKKKKKIKLVYSNLLRH